MVDRSNSAAALDIASHLHPYTNARKHEAEGPLVLAEGKRDRSGGSRSAA